MTKKSRKKIRVALKKNRQKKSRPKSFTRELLDELENRDLETSERLTGKGDLTRYRTVVGVEAGESADGSSVSRHVDESQCLGGRVICAVGLNAIVQAEQGQRYECTVRRLVRNLAREERNAVVAGDRVLFRPVVVERTGFLPQGVIERIEPRRSTLSRGSQHREHVLVANVDQVLIVASADDPPLKPNLIDRFLVSAEKGGAKPTVCINKVDLCDLPALQPVAGRYGRLGYDVVLTSVPHQTGLARLRSLLQGCQTVFTGQSGVGKSSLLNALDPGLELRINEISADTGKGRHTTRSALLLELECGGWVVDTPGIRQFQLWDVSPEEVEEFFVEFRPFVATCKFPDCSHLHEPGCGVKKAVDHDLISPTRYTSYVRIVTGDME